MANCGAFRRTILQRICYLLFAILKIQHPLEKHNSLETPSERVRDIQVMRMLRLLFWFLFFIVATFSWIVLIEHGPENFWEGSRIELENLWATFARGSRPGR